MWRGKFKISTETVSRGHLLHAAEGGLLGTSRVHDRPVAEPPRIQMGTAVGDAVPLWCRSRPRGSVATVPPARRCRPGAEGDVPALCLLGDGVRGRYIQSRSKLKSQGFSKSTSPLPENTRIRKKAWPLVLMCLSLTNAWLILARLKSKNTKKLDLLSFCY